MTEITLKDGRIFNSKFSKLENAIADIFDYIYCEYDERISIEDITKIETFKQ